MDPLPGTPSQDDPPAALTPLAADLPSAASEAAIAAEHAAEPCPRCRKPVGLDAERCPWCGAIRRRPVATSTPQSGEEDWRPWKILLIGYATTLFAFVLFGLILDNSSGEDVENELSQLRWLLVIDTVFAAIVGICFYQLRGRTALELTPRMRWFTAWPAGFLTLFVALAANYGYHWQLKALGIPELELIPSDTRYWPWWVATICVQPAIIEELFFRGCCWRVMTPVMGIHATVLVSSVMFGMAHIGVPLSVPVLTVVGVALGYARVWSGSLLLPAILHFLHNLVVILW